MVDARSKACHARKKGKCPDSPVRARVLFLASEYVSKQVRVVPSINRPTRVNPSVFCSLKKEPW
jgi:hypothetical protein